MDKSADASRVPEDATTHVRSVANEIAGAPSEHQLRQVKELRPRDPAAANRLLAKLEGALLDGPVDAGVARYVPLEKIGAGGLGTVYAAYDPELDRKVAVKFVRTDPEGVNARARLVREAQAMAQLNHPNVAAVHDVGTVGNEVFIAMELVDGVTLSGWWRAEKRSWKQVRDMMLQAGRGLSAAHAAGLVHRDFKPPNVLVGTDGRVRVLDFGLARTWHNDVPAPRFVPAAGKGVDANLTDSRLLLGTPAYMAPEQITGGSVGPAADQFAFCATLFEGIHGARPFQGDDVSKLMQSVIDGRVTRPTSPARIPAWLHKTIKRGMSTDPAQRFPSMDALLFALEHDRRSRRKQWFVAATVAVVSIVAALLGVFLLRPVPTEEDRAWVAALAAEAREAAEKGRYLYPPPDSPDIETAYQWVRKLERVEGSGSSIARTAADDLRSDLASDLLALGDQYWDRDGGRAFASDYYGMALVFDPDVDRRARARSAQTPGEAADIKARADEGSFSREELLAAESLAVLAEVDAAEREQRLSAYVGRDDTSPTRVARVEALVKPKRRGKARTAPSTPAPDPVPPTRAKPEPPVAAAPPDSSETGGLEVDDSEGEASKRLADRGLAKRLAKEASAFEKKGDRATAKARFSAALNADSRYAPAAYGLAKVHFDTKQRGPALRYAKRAVKLAPGNVEYRLFLADLHKAAFSYDEARTHYEAAAKLGSARAKQRLAQLGGVDGGGA